MSDVFSKAKRSDVMSRIRSRGNKATELALVALFRRYHIVGWRRHQSLGLGHSPLERGDIRSRPSTRVKPDFVFRHCRLAVFVDGCFWHGCRRHGTKPKSNAEFWQAKLATNMARDQYVTKSLRLQKWRVLRIWEHQLAYESRVIARIKGKITLGQHMSMDISLTGKLANGIHENWPKHGMSPEKQGHSRRYRP